MRNLLVVLVAVLIYCYRSPFFHMVEPVSYSLSLPEKFEGGISINEKLDQADRLHENVIHWPESLAQHKGNIYTGLGDGRIVRVSSKQITDICRTGIKCEGHHEEHICGRPLGMRFSSTGVLYVADAYHGLFAINVDTGSKKQLLSGSTLIDGKPLIFLNSVALDEKDNVIYITQSSSKWNISHVVVSTLEHDTSGRLLKFDMNTGKTSVLVDNLAFPNGIEMSKDGSALLVAEMLKTSIFKYYIRGPMKGQQTKLASSLPGEPDNLSRNPRGNYWIGINNARTMESPTIYDRVSEKPFLRKLFLHLHKLSTMPIYTILRLLPYKWAQETGAELHNGRIFADLFPSHGLILEMDENGKIIQSMHSPSGSVTHISEVMEYNGYLYLGSWRNHYLGRLKL